MLIGLNLSSWLAQKRNLETGLISDLLPLLVLFSVIGARIYYVAFEWHNYSGHWLKAFAIWEGGIAIHGALIGGTLTLMLFCRWRLQSFWSVLDVLVPSVALGQAIGRWGNFFNSEAFGVPTDLPWKLFIPYANRPTIYSGSEYFHPTFLYESLWNLVLFIGLVALFQAGQRRPDRLPNGALSCFYLIGYSLGGSGLKGSASTPCA